MHSLIKKTLLLIPLTMLDIAQAALPETIAVWAGKSDGAYAVYTSELYESGWTTPEVAAKSDNRIIAPAIGSNSFMIATQDKKLTANLATQGLITVWTEMIEDQWLLKFATREGGNWTKPQQLTTLAGENLASTIVHDLGGNPWVVWSSNVNGNDDVYFTHRINGSWSEAEMVNQPNQFPDFAPTTHVANNGSVVVAWDTLDTEANVFMKSEKNFPNNSGIVPSTKSNEEVINLNTPEAARTTARINLHFPANKFSQSEFVQTGFPSIPH